MRVNPLDPFDSPIQECNLDTVQCPSSCLSYVSDRILSEEDLPRIRVRFFSMLNSLVSNHFCHVHRQKKKDPSRRKLFTSGSMPPSMSDTATMTGALPMPDTQWTAIHLSWLGLCSKNTSSLSSSHRATISLVGAVPSSNFLFKSGGLFGVRLG